MSSHFIFPKPKDWDIFEDIVCDVVSRKFNNNNLQRYGRSGQKQFGVDIAGFTRNVLSGFQCKHHPNGNITKSEIHEEIKKADNFQPPLDKFVIATSADRDSAIHSYILEISKLRKERNEFPVSILFWQDIYNWLVEYPDLLYKHFTKYFPLNELEKTYVSPINEQVRNVSQWPVSSERLKENISQVFGALTKIDPYIISVGFTTFQDVSYSDVADLVISLPELFDEDKYSEQNFNEAARILNSVKSTLKDPYFSEYIRFHIQSRLSAAFLLGWIFRRVTHFDLEIIQNDQVWVTKGLPFVPSRIYDFLPVLINSNSNDVIMVLNISRNIEESVISFIKDWAEQPKAVLVYGLEGNQILSPAHAQSVASDVSKKIKNVIDRWQVRHVHLFSAMPAGLATLISFNLNAICPISLYFLDESRTNYKLGGILKNNI
jgi:hypothetical protein